MHEKTQRYTRASNGLNIYPNTTPWPRAMAPHVHPTQCEDARLLGTRQYRPWIIAGLLALICLTALWGAVASGAHVPELHWMAPYRAADGSACCGITDCLKAEITLLSPPMEEMVRVLVRMAEDGRQGRLSAQTVVVVPGRSIHRSEDAHSWYCTKSHFQSWNASGETTHQPCVTATGYRIITPCTRCIFINVGV